MMLWQNHHNLLLGHRLQPQSILLETPHLSTRLIIIQRVAVTNILCQPQPEGVDTFVDACDNDGYGVGCGGMNFVVVMS